MNDERRTANFGTFNPYEFTHPGRILISREEVLLAKRLRREGFSVTFGVEEVSQTDYVFRKGFDELLAAPVLIKLAGIGKDLAIGIVSSWLYDLRKDAGGSSGEQKQVSVVIEMSADGRHLRFDQSGQEIGDGKLRLLLAGMSQRQTDFARTVSAQKPHPTLDAPIFLEHSRKPVGWCRVVPVEGVGLTLSSYVITDDETRERVKRGELRGFSVSGIAIVSTCQICGEPFQDCPHDSAPEGQALCVIEESSLCEVSIVKSPVNPSCEFGEYSGGDEVGDREGGH